MVSVQILLSLSDTVCLDLCGATVFQPHPCVLDSLSAVQSWIFVNVRLVRGREDRNNL